MTERDEDRLPGGPQPTTAPDEPQRPTPAGDPAAASAARLTHDPVCTSYG